MGDHSKGQRWLNIGESINAIYHINKRKYLNLIKAVYDKTLANIVLTSEKPKAFPLRFGKKKRLSIHTTLIEHRTENPSQSHRAIEKSKRHRNWE